MLVVKEIEGETHKYTNLETALEVGSDPFELTGNKNQQSAYVEVCSVTAGNNKTAESIIVAIGKKSGGCATRTQPYIDSTIEMATVPTECENKAKSIQIKNTATGKPESWDCADLDFIAPQARKQFCRQNDIQTKKKVFNICRLQCPQTRCVA